MERFTNKSTYMFLSLHLVVLVSCSGTIAKEDSSKNNDVTNGMYIDDNDTDSVALYKSAMCYNTAFQLRVNGDYAYIDTTYEQYAGNFPGIFIGKYPKLSNNKIYFKAGSKDTNFTMDFRNIKRLMFGCNADSTLFVVTDKDTSNWIVD